MKLKIASQLSIVKCCNVVILLDWLLQSLNKQIYKQNSEENKTCVQGCKKNILYFLKMFSIFVTLLFSFQGLHVRICYILYGTERHLFIY